MTAAAFAAAALVVAPTAMAQVGFGPVFVGEERTVRIAMTGDGPFTAGEPVIMGPDAGPFVVYGDGCGDQSHPDGECFVEVRFAPWRTGAHSATLVLPVEGEPEPISVPLTGEGLPVTAITPAELDFGTVPYQSPPPAREVIVENTSDRTLGPLSILLPGPRLPSWFERVADSCSGTTIAPGATCRMSIGFTAARRGSAVSQLIVTSEPDARLLGEIPLRGATPPVPPRVRLPRPLPLPRPAPPATPDFSAALEERLGAA